MNTVSLTISDRRLNWCRSLCVWLACPDPSGAGTFASSTGFQSFDSIESAMIGFSKLIAARGRQEMRPIHMAQALGSSQPLRPQSPVVRWPTSPA